jgi:hypothetical protein
MGGGKIYEGKDVAGFGNLVYLTAFLLKIIDVSNWLNSGILHEKI